MSDKLTATKLKMAALGFNMVEAGEEIYRHPPKKDKLNESKDKKESK
jgi:hypothetical protein